MKYITYILIAVFLSSVLFAAIPATVYSQDKLVTLQCSNPNASSEEIQRSAEIIESRLKDFGVKKFKLMIDESAIIIHLNKKVDLELITPLLTLEGELGFFESTQSIEIINRIKSMPELKALLHFSDTHQNNHILGACNAGEKANVNKLLNSGLKAELKAMHVKLCWYHKPVNEGQWELYLMNSNAVVGGNMLASAEFVSKKRADFNSINMRFDAKGSAIWETVTERNIEKPIIIAIDDKVYAAPTVKAVIKGGYSSITGDFSKQEAQLLVTLLNNPALPVAFQLKN